jgi:hypothetical protein
LEDWFCDSITSNNITCLNEGGDALNHSRREITGNCRKIDLYMISRMAMYTTELVYTFMSAFESLPVHWLKSRPSGKRRIPGKAGTAAKLLTQLFSNQQREHKWDRPMINIFNNLFCTRSPMLNLQVLVDPFHKVIFEDPLDKLVKNVGCKKFMNICAWKAMRVRLKTIKT